MMKDLKIFLSYCWTNKDIADRIYNDFKSLGITLLRDIWLLNYKDPIKKLTDMIREADFVIMLISDAFLKSLNCMHEVLELSKKEGYAKKLIHINLNCTDIFAPKGKARYVKYWEKEFNQLKAKIKKLEPENVSNLSKDLKSIKEINLNIDDFLNTISTELSAQFENLKDNSYKPILDYIGFDDSSLMVKLLILNSIENVNEKEVEIEKFLSIHPDFYLGYYVKSFQYHRKNPLLSIECYTQAIKLKNDFIEAVNNRGLMYFNLNRFDEALQDFNKALELNMKYSISINNKGMVYEKLGKLTDAIDEYSKAISLDPVYLDALLNRGRAYIEVNDNKNAIIDYNQVIELAPNCDEAFCNRGLANSKLGNIRDCIADLNTAIKIDSGNYLYYFHRAIGYFKVGRYKKSINDYIRSIRLKPDFFQAYVNLGNIFHSRGKTKLADNYFEKAEKINPNLKFLKQSRNLPFENLIKILPDDIHTINRFCVNIPINPIVDCYFLENTINEALKFRLLFEKIYFIKYNKDDIYNKIRQKKLTGETLTSKEHEYFEQTNFNAKKNIKEKCIINIICQEDLRTVNKRIQDKILDIVSNLECQLIDDCYDRLYYNTPYIKIPIGMKLTEEKIIEKLMNVLHK